MSNGQHTITKEIRESLEIKKVEFLYGKANLIAVNLKQNKEFRELSIYNN